MLKINSNNMRLIIIVFIVLCTYMAWCDLNIEWLDVYGMVYPVFELFTKVSPPPLVSYNSPEVITNPFAHAPFTDVTQNTIALSQNPPGCKNIKVLKTELFGKCGFGCHMHVTGSHLAYAMDNGYVLMWGENACRDYSASCKSLFLPLSTCSIKDAVSVNYIRHGGPFRFIIPKSLLQFQDKLNMTYNRFLYWWRGQSITYVMRIKPSVLSELNLKPLNEGTVHIHMRFGDKTSEASLIHVNSYIRAYYMLLENYKVSRQHIFVSSDTSTSIEIFKERVSANNPSVKIQHYPVQYTGFNLHMLQYNTNNNITVDFLREIYTALQASAWIGTRFSNVDRIIDELRCTLVAKCHLPYVNLGAVRGDDYDW